MVCSLRSNSQLSDHLLTCFHCRLLFLVPIRCSMHYRHSTWLSSPTLTVLPHPPQSLELLLQSRSHRVLKSGMFVSSNQTEYWPTDRLSSYFRTPISHLNPFRQKTQSNWIRCGQTKFVTRSWCRRIVEHDAQIIHRRLTRSTCVSSHFSILAIAYHDTHTFP
jgi:hypothetical protein